LAVAEVLRDRGAEITLLISPKEIDQLATRSTRMVGLDVRSLPAVALTRSRLPGFLWGFTRSYAAARRLFRDRPPDAVLAMGGFTSAPPILAARRLGALTFLHESNSVPGRANRWLAPWVHQVFVFFPSARERLRNPRVEITGMPVRAQFRPRDAGLCREQLGLNPARPTLLVTGGSQGAQGLNHLVLSALPQLASRYPDLQFLHLTGPREVEIVRNQYAQLNRTALVQAFLDAMELAMNAADLAINRAGASSLAELSALGLPAVLVPYPAAADNHQHFNALAFADSGAAYRLDQRTATASDLVLLVSRLLDNRNDRMAMSGAVRRWHSPQAAHRIADHLWRASVEPREAGCCPPRCPASSHHRFA
jgi:UDP-N-acetylglucosamine--N-acetylmuramyl-(pentapeptide) pyrophosphoryl-undecaprenol N-acetylglucosamine transferase